MMLENKVALITGASRGIGREIALCFAKEGAKVVLCATNQALLDDLVCEIERSECPKPLAFAFDIQDVKQIEHVVKKTLDTHSRIDILLNNAGVTRDKLLAFMSEEDWDVVLSINLKSVFVFTKAVSRLMIRQKSGRIINMSSIIGLTGNAGQANYAASKAGIIALTKSAAKELARRNITVNAIAPGFIQTRMTEHLSDEIREEMKKRIALGRFGEPKDVANAALFLASDLSSYVTGQVIRVDGGIDT